MATLTASVTEGAAPLPVNFTVAGTDADGDPLTYELAFGDAGTPASGDLPTEIISYVYTVGGAYVATLTVSDGIDTATATVSITAIAPSGPGHVENWYFSMDGAAETCIADFLVADLAAAVPDDNWCQFQAANVVFTTVGETPVAGPLEESAVAQTGSRGFASGTVVKGVIHMVAVDVAGDPMSSSGDLAIGLKAGDGTSLGSVTQAATLAADYNEIVFEFAASAEIVPNDALTLTMNYSGVSYGILWGGGAEHPTGFSLGGDYVPA